MLQNYYGLFKGEKQIPLSDAIVQIKQIVHPVSTFFKRIYNSDKKGF